MATIQATDWLNRDKIIRRGADVKLRNVYNSGFGEREAWKDNLQGNLVIDGNNGDGAPNDFAALTHIELRGVNGQEANKMELTGLTLRNLPNLRFLIVENNHLANLDLAGARNLISLDISDNTELVNLDLRPTPNLFSLDLHGSGVNPINIQGLGQLGQLRTWNGGSDIATDGYKVIPLGGNAKTAVLAEIERLRVAHDDLPEVPIGDFCVQLLLHRPQGGAGVENDGTGLNGGHDQAAIDNWINQAADDENNTLDKLHEARKVLTRMRAQVRINNYLGNDPVITPQELKDEINRLDPNTIPPVDVEATWETWLRRARNEADVERKEQRLIKALASLKKGKQARKALAYEEVEALRAHVGLADADFKAELRKPIADGGANAATEGDGDAGTRTLRDTGNANQDWQNWLTIAADTDAETNPKKEIALRILRRRQAVARVNAELGTITNDDLKNRINDATGLPGSIGANTIQPADSWKVWMDKSADLDTVYNRETQLITALTYLKAGGQNRKALAYEEVEALRAHVGLADADFKAELRKPIADGGANAATEGDGDAGTRTLRDTGNANQDWQNWLTIAADTDAETNPKKEIALRILRRRQAVARVNAELGTITNDDLKNRINDATGLPGSIGANTIQPADSWKVWMDKSADLDTVYNRETQLITALTYLKAGGQNRKALAYEEVEALRAHVGLADADFKAELRKPIADGGANAATEGDGDAGTRTLRDTGNANQDWQNWLTRAADTDEETNTKKSNALRVLRRIQYAENIIDEVKGYLNDPATGAKDDAALNTELNRPLNTGGGQALNIGGAGPASWKAWLREGASPHQALERGILAMKAAVIVKNADRKVSDKLLEASLAKIELYRKAHQDYKGTDLPEIGYDVLIQALVNEGADNGPDGFNGGTDKTAFVTWMGKSVPAGFLGRWWGTGTEAKEVKDIELKEEQVLTIIARKRAIARLEALQNTLGVSHEDFVKKLKQAPNQGGISADATLDETAAGAEAAWHSLFNGLNKVELVTSKETEMAQSLGVAKGGVAGGGDLKAAAIDEVDVAFTAARTAIPAFTHTVFKTELNNKAAAAIGDTATDDNVAWHAWLNAAANDTQTAQRKNTALKVIAAYRAINRVESLFDANVDAAKLGTELRKTDGDGGGIGYVGFGFGGVHANYINAAPDVEAVAEREGKVMKAIGILKAGGTQKTRADGYANDITGLLTGTDGTDGSDPANWKTQLKSKLDDLKNIKTFAKDKLGFDLDAVPYSGNLSSLKTAIENKLGTSKLSDITTGNLTDLINKPDTSTLTNQLNQEKQKVTDFETKLGVKLNELDGKLGSKKLSNIPDGKTLEKLLQEDPTALQTKIDQLNAQLNDKEKEVVKSIHDALSLGIAEGSITKDEVLKKIREKIVGGGGDTQKDQQIKDLTAEVNNLKNQTNTIVKEVVVEKIVDNTKAQETYGFTFTTAEQEQIKSAGSAKEALAKTNEIIKGKMETLQSSKKTANTLNWVLGGLSVVSLVWLAYLLVKGSSGLLSEGDEKKEGEK